ncbi:MAG: hypothetical protein HN576_06470 [Bacteriovoracaceae bacterium]|nr:hypothetical protein [Bacteriovoracaceae bacterium]
MVSQRLFQFDYLKKVSKNSICSTTEKLSSNEKIIISNQFFHIKDIKPSKLLVEVKYIENGKLKLESRSFSIREHQLKNKYILPLKGNIWGLPGPTTGSGHHRQTAPHLHFHLMDGPDFLTSRSLPIRFENSKPYPWDDSDEIFDFWETRDPMIKSTQA